jgi:hypothetical protein
VSQKLPVSVGIGILLLSAALSGCVIKDDGEPAALDGHEDHMGMANETSGPTAVIVISANGTELYSSADSEGSPSSSSASSGNATASNNTSGGNTTASSANATSPSGNATSSPTASSGNGSKEGSAAVVVEPGVNVTFDASDSDGLNLTYAWTVGNDTFENATFDYAFNETGTFTVTLTVTDDENATDEESVDVVVESASGGAGSGPAGDRQETFTGAPTGGYYIGAPNCVQGGAQAESSFTWTILGADENGSAVKAVKLVVTAGHGSAGVAHRLTLEDPEGNELGQGTEISVEGEFPAGDYTVIYRLCGPLSSAGASETVATASYEYA